MDGLLLGLVAFSAVAPQLAELVGSSCVTSGSITLFSTVPRGFKILLGKRKLCLIQENRLHTQRGVSSKPTAEFGYFNF